MRLLLLLVFLFSVSQVWADDLTSRLRQLLPGEEPATVNERQFLHQRVREMYDGLDGAKISGKSTKKKIARIESLLNRSYFRSYNSGAQLTDAFRRGQYNDATATVLMALALEHFNIEYYALVDHWEAYLLADPTDQKKELRHPASRKRNEEMETTFQANFIELIRATINPDLEVRGKEQISMAFADYYYQPRKLLTFGQLAAYALFQEGNAAYRNRNYQLAIDLATRAAQREHRPAFLMLRRAAEIQMAVLGMPEKTGDIATFYKYWTKDPENKYYPAAILNHFDEQQQILLATDRPDLARKLLDDFASKAPAGSAVWEQELIKLQRFRLIDHFYKKGRLDLAKAEAEVLYKADPDNETVRFLLGELVIGGLRRTNVKGGDYGRIVQAAAEQYPFIREQDRFADLLLRELAWKVRDLFAIDNLGEANEALNRFRTALIDIPIGRKRSLWTLTAFYAASDFYFRQKDFGEARAFIAEALEYSPEDQFLLHRSDILNRY